MAGVNYCTTSSARVPHFLGSPPQQPIYIAPNSIAHPSKKPRRSMTSPTITPSPAFTQIKCLNFN